MRPGAGPDHTDLNAVIGGKSLVSGRRGRYGGPGLKKTTTTDRPVTSTSLTYYRSDGTRL